MSSRLLGWIGIGIASLALPAAADVPTPYTKMKGDCPGNNLDHTVPAAVAARKSKQTVQSCQAHCDSEAKCVGFSYNAGRQDCYLKGGVCKTPTSNGFDFYTKPIRKYVKMNGDCPGNNLDHTVPAAVAARKSKQTVESCQAHCESEARCLGFSYNAGRQDCYLKGGVCTTPTSNGFIFYSKPAPTYTKMGGDCPGNNLDHTVPAAVAARKSKQAVESCQAHCSGEAKCLGFSYNADRQDCYLKGGVCTTPTNNGFIFYSKQR